MLYPLMDIPADFGSNRPSRYQITAKRNYLYIRTDRQTDGQTDVAYDNNRYFFISKKEKLIITRGTRGVRVFFSVTRMRSSNSARINKSDFTTEKIV